MSLMYFRTRISWVIWAHAEMQPDNKI